MLTEPRSKTYFGAVKGRTPLLELVVDTAVNDLRAFRLLQNPPVTNWAQSYKI